MKTFGDDRCGSNDGIYLWYTIKRGEKWIKYWLQVLSPFPNIYMSRIDRSGALGFALSVCLQKTSTVPITFEW